MHIVLDENDVNKVRSWLITRNDLTRGWAMILCFHSVIRVTCFRFIWSGKVSTVFSRAGWKFSPIRCSICSSGILVIHERERARAIEETDVIRQGMLGCHGNRMWLITEYIINFKRTELDEVRSGGVIGFCQSNRARQKRLRDFKHCARDSQIFHWR